MVDTSNVDLMELEIGRLAGLPRAELVERWIKVYRASPPKGIKRGLLERSCAYQLQARQFGGLKPATAKALFAIARDKSVERKTSDTELRSGARLLREWHGVSHQVEVLDDGFVWKGQHFASLSAVAQAITGAKWSGPRFFGL